MVATAEGTSIQTMAAKEVSKPSPVVTAQAPQPSSETQAANEEAKAAKAAAAQLQQEADEMKAKLQAALDDAVNLKMALAEAKAAQAQSAALARSAKSQMMPSVCPSSIRLEGNRIIGTMTQEELDTHYDCVIIGGGPVGVAAAMKSAVLGHRCIIVDKPKATPAPNGLDVSFGGPTGLFFKGFAGRRQACRCSIIARYASGRRCDLEAGAQLNFQTCNL
jgi:succinate dehydrogenase/fumarate reductase flavoprotein subunit